MTEPLKDLSDPPGQRAGEAIQADLLSHVLASVRLEGERIFTRALPALVEARLEPVEAAHLFIVAEGSISLQEQGGEPTTVGPGDLLLLPNGQGDLRLLARLGAVTLVVCRFRFDPEALRGMLFTLPRAIHVRHGDAGAWLDGLRRFLLIEAADDQPGASLMISRLIDLLVIRTLRSWIHGGAASGWLLGLSDPRVARVLKTLHEQPLQRWSITALAEIAGMSRSSFCDRFAQLVGHSPLRYQNERRLAVARRMLRQDNVRVGEVGLAVGYESEAAFSRAYRAHFGHSPRAERPRLEAVP